MSSSSGKPASASAPAARKGSVLVPVAALSKLQKCYRRCQADEIIRRTRGKAKPVTGARARTTHTYTHKGRDHTVYRSKTGKYYINVTDPKTKKRKRKTVPAPPKPKSK